MPKIADSVELTVVLGGKEPKYELIVDGEPFPWYTNGIEHFIDKSTQPEVTITIPVRDIKIVHRFG